MRTKRNKFVPANLLPPEALSRVFECLQTPILDAPYSLPGSIHQWMAVARVCRYWRNTALSYPHLWTHIYIQHPFDDIARMHIRYSAQAPIKVYLPSTSAYCRSIDSDFDEEPDEYPVEADLISAIALHPERVRELHVDYRFLAQEYPSPLFLLPFPNLEALSIFTEWQDAHAPYLPPLFASDVCSRLTKVLFGNPRMWCLDSFSNLTHISWYKQLLAERPPLARFLDALAASPLLEELVLNDAGPDISPDQVGPVSGLPIVDLPCLQRLEVGDWNRIDRPLSVLLSHLKIPRHTTRYFWGDDLEPPAQLLRNFNSGDSETVHEDIRKVFITGTGGRADRNQLMGVEGQVLHLVGHIDHSEYLTLFADQTFPDVDEFVLCPGPGRAMLPNDLREIFNNLPYLSTFTFTDSQQNVETVALGLGLLNNSTSEGSTPTPVPAPLLTKINLYHDHDMSYNYYASSQPRKLLPIVLLAQQRAQMGHPIKEFRIEDAPSEETSRKDLIEILRQYVEKVEEITQAERYNEADQSWTQVWHDIRFAWPILRRTPPNRARSPFAQSYVI
ncbi:hypothetical protein NLJ89_g4410 [Agrocybe chaxingu]|uniref:F-box domain-containing protein n=1 Tax=Agrocybe chaxingu TaxID=84603 RepID=A0A9W8K2W2_9AGAR|nr:hypothetical protein NLJ89_g4410 [Agrocybe chaxingu]